MRRTRNALLLAAALLAPPLTSSLPAQQQPPAEGGPFYRALDLENAGRYKEAAPLFRQALKGENAVNALLGLERVYAELGWVDSLLVPLDSLINAQPREPVYRSVQFRALSALGRERETERAFERWVKDVPGDPTPFREFSRLLLQRGRAAAADTIIRRGQIALGSTKDLQLEIAQMRAALGLWEQSAEAWRGALKTQPYLEQAAVYALTPTPGTTREAIRRIFIAPPIDVGARLALAGLETSWGSPRDGWQALKDLPPDSVSAAAWVEFAERAEREERWHIARDAYMAAHRWKPSPELGLKTAAAALAAGDPAVVLSVAPFRDAGTDSTLAARRYVPLHARALAMMGRPVQAERLVAQYDRWLTPGARAQLARHVAFGWVRSGDMTKARAALSAAGAEADSSDAAGWLALYEGNLKTARSLLRTGGESTPELALALGLVARLRGVDSAVDIGQAFLALARGDSAGAAQRFLAAADHYAPARSILVMTAAQVRRALRDDAQAVALWKRVVEQYGDAPEAPEALLEWARALRRQGDQVQAVAKLEHLILTYPQSALVPLARRELELAKSNIPGTV